MVSPSLRVRWPMPPPRVSPPTPVLEMIPAGTARPNAWVAWSTSPSRAPPSTRAVCATGIDADAAHPREVDDEAVVDGAEARRAVAAAADRDVEALVAAEADGRDDVGDVGGTDDQRRDACRSSRSGHDGRRHSRDLPGR